MPLDAGSAYVTIFPSLDGFTEALRAKLDAALATVRPEVHVGVDVDTGALRAALAAAVPATVPFKGPDLPVAQTEAYAAATRDAADANGDLARKTIEVTAATGLLAAAERTTTAQRTSTGTLLRQTARALPAAIAVAYLVTPLLGLAAAAATAVISLAGVVAGLAAVGFGLAAVAAGIAYVTVQWAGATAGSTAFAQRASRDVLAVREALFEAGQTILAGVGGVGGVLQKLTSLIIEGIQKATPILEHFAAWLIHLFDSISHSPVIGELAQIFRSWIHLLEGFFTGVGPALFRLFVQFQGPAQALVRGLGEVLRSLFAGIAFGLSSGQLTAFINNLFGFLAGIVRVWPQLSAALDGLGLALSKVALALLPIFQAGIREAALVLSGFVSPVLQVVAGLLKWLSLPVVRWISGVVVAIGLLGLALRTLTFGTVTLSAMGAAVKYLGTVLPNVILLFRTLAIGQAIRGTAGLLGLGNLVTSLEALAARFPLAVAVAPLGIEAILAYILGSIRTAYRPPTSPIPVTGAFGGEPTGPAADAQIRAYYDNVRQATNATLALRLTASRFDTTQAAVAKVLGSTAQGADLTTTALKKLTLTNVAAVSPAQALALATAGYGHALVAARNAVEALSGPSFAGLRQFAAASGQSFATLANTAITAIESIPKDGGAALKTFYIQQAQAISDWRHQMAQAFNFVAQSLQTLAGQSHLTAQQILRDFRQQLQAQIRYAANWRTIVREGAPLSLRNQLAAMGQQGAGIVAALAHANHHQFGQIVSTWQRAGGQARAFSGTLATTLGVTLGKLTSAIVLMVSALTGIPVPQIQAKINAITRSMQGLASQAGAAQGHVSALQRAINALHGKNINLGLTASRFGPIHAQTGFHGVVREPTLFMAGEGGTAESVDITPGGHGYTRLHPRDMRLLAREIARALRGIADRPVSVQATIGADRLQRAMARRAGILGQT